MTISREIRTTLVIILSGVAAAQAAGADELTASSGLTTQAVAPVAATLTTVVVNGSTVFDAPRLFGAYRDSLGKPITRESARAIVSALADLYARDGYVKPEIRLDDALIASGVLRAVFDVLGMQDVVAKSIGSSNPYNMVRATFDALKHQHSPRSVAARRNVKVSTLQGRRRDVDAEQAAD